MKKIILALATLLFMGSAATKAQVTKVTVRSISGNSKEEVENIDNAKYRITYEGKWVNNPSIKPFIYTDSEMRLDIGEKATCFYDRTKQVKDSLMDEKAKTGNFDFSDLPKGGRFPFSYYKNYPSTGKSIQLESVGTTDYKCTENVETPDWQLIPDSATTIIGYHCQQLNGRGMADEPNFYSARRYYPMHDRCDRKRRQHVPAGRRRCGRCHSSSGRTGAAGGMPHARRLSDWRSQSNTSIPSAMSVCHSYAGTDLARWTCG